MSRRQAVGTMAGIAASAALAPHARAFESAGNPARAGRLKQSVSRWCYGKLSLEDLCVASKKIGLSAIDLLDEKEWGTPTQFGLSCAMANGFGSIPKGFNRPDNHDKLVADAERMMPLAAAAGVPNIVCFSGNRAGMSDGEGIANCIAGLKRITSTAERVGVTLCLELLNSKVDHHDYHADHTAWGVQVVQGVGSPRLKLLYDIYHMQVMEGDVCDTIKENYQCFGHYHTAGVPGRHEIDDTQELHYPAIMRTIVATGFKGCVAQEFGAKNPDRLAALRQAVQLCDV